MPNIYQFVGHILSIDEGMNKDFDGVGKLRCSSRSTKGSSCVQTAGQVHSSPRAGKMLYVAARSALHVPRLDDG